MRTRTTGAIADRRPPLDRRRGARPGGAGISRYEATTARPIRNFRIPAELDPATLPGIVWSGARAGDVVLYEFFDYNCGFCRKAARDLDETRRR